MKNVWSSFTKGFKAIVLEEPFIFTTGLAALIHSTWTLGTLFTGPEPSQGTSDWWYWVIPAFLIAFSLDVGQIVTSAQIREARKVGNNVRGKYITFFVFAVFTYYLQWTYIATHLPLIALGSGIRKEWIDALSFLRDCAVFVGPALLPITTFMHTVTGGATKLAQPKPVTIKRPAPMPVVTSKALVPVQGTTQFRVTCPDCGWQSNPVDKSLASRVMQLHKESCKAINAEVIEEISL